MANSESFDFSIAGSTAGCASTYCVQKTENRKRIIHTLALKPCNRSELLDRLIKEGISEFDKSQVFAILYFVGTFNGELFHLHTKLWKEVEDDWRFYSPEDAAIVKKRKQEACQTDVNRVPNDPPSKESLLMNEIFANSAPVQKKQKKTGVKEENSGVRLVQYAMMNSTPKNCPSPASESKKSNEQVISFPSVNKKQDRKRGKLENSSLSNSEEKSPTVINKTKHALEDVCTEDSLVDEIIANSTPVQKKQKKTGVKEENPGLRLVQYGMMNSTPKNCPTPVSESEESNDQVTSLSSSYEKYKKNRERKRKTNQKLPFSLNNSSSASKPSQSTSTSLPSFFSLTNAEKNNDWCSIVINKTKRALLRDCVSKTEKLFSTSAPPRSRSASAPPRLRSRSASAPPRLRSRSASAPPRLRSQSASAPSPTLSTSASPPFHSPPASPPCHSPPASSFSQSASASAPSQASSAAAPSQASSAAAPSQASSASAPSQASSASAPSQASSASAPSQASSASASLPSHSASASASLPSHSASASPPSQSTSASPFLQSFSVSSSTNPASASSSSNPAPTSSSNPVSVSSSSDSASFSSSSHSAASSSHSDQVSSTSDPTRSILRRMYKILTSESSDNDANNFRRNFTKITSLEQRNRYKEFFDHQWPVYTAFKESVMSANEKMAHLEENLKTLSKGTQEYEAALRKLFQTYKMYFEKSQYKECSRLLVKMRQKLSYIRRLIREFDIEHSRNHSTF
ncbi:RNA polymerase II elongation factor Ell like protein [Argiope bruennichi]|uniref:RNA polymerase II elongation factor Ell like protein n=1 Tax=Argiope bruennichi TaxID=94029 RepID=A0A8T0FK67_ARGBR|nr:RNA polymerase II elongation factor Ell like protein [Argiope bruennichi]